jgi:hypothetical protein
MMKLAWNGLKMRSIPMAYSVRNAKGLQSIIDLPKGQLIPVKFVGIMFTRW